MNAPSNVTLHWRYLFLRSFSHPRRLHGSFFLSLPLPLFAECTNIISYANNLITPPWPFLPHLFERGQMVGPTLLYDGGVSTRAYTSIYYSLLWHLPLEDLLRRHVRGLWETSSSFLSVAVFDEIAPNFSNSEPSQPRDELWTTFPPSSSGAHAPRWGKSFLVFALGKIVLKE